MSRRITPQPHLTTDELFQRYRACRRPNEKARRRALHLVSRGTLAAEAARRVGRTSGWVTQLTRRYNERGAEAVPDRQSDARPAPPPSVEAAAAAAGSAALRCAAPDGGLRTAPKVAAWVEERTGRRVHETTAWRAMRRLGFSLQVPRPRCEWLWVYAAARPQTGRVFWLVLPHLSAAMMRLFLDAFAREHAPEGKRVVLARDGASAHRAKSPRVPERLTLVSLPAYTPELNRAERLWPLVKEGVANRTHESLAALEDTVCGRCHRITAEQVTALTNYHWWPAA